MASKGAFQPKACYDSMTRGTVWLIFLREAERDQGVVRKRRGMMVW